MKGLYLLEAVTSKRKHFQDFLLYASESRMVATWKKRQQNAEQNFYTVNTDPLIPKVIDHTQYTGMQ